MSNHSEGTAPIRDRQRTAEESAADRAPLRRRRPSDRRGRAGRRLDSAGHALLAGLACFAIWLFLDAEQLYSNAYSASPLGTRRTVAVTLLRPIASLEHHLYLDRVVSAADRLIGRTGPATPGGSAVVTSTAPPKRSLPPGRRTTGVTPSGPKGASGLAAAFPQPSSKKPVTVLDIGDSIGEDLGIGLSDLIGNHRDIRIIQSAVGDTGLANPGYYNWPANLKSELAADHPSIVVMMFGGNDWQPFLAGPNTIADPGTAYWRAQYGARVQEMIRMATAAGARVFWVGLPPMGPTSELPATMAPSLNAVYQQESEANRATFVPIWSAFLNKAGAYSEYLPNAAGQLVEVRDPDGVHLAPPAGCDLAAGIVVKAIDATLHITL